MRTIRTRVTAATLALATVVLALAVTLVATPAQASWTDAGGITRLKVCRTDNPSHPGWLFLVKARKRAGTEDARAGVAIRVAGDRRQRWGSGWLRDREVERGWVRTHHTRRVRLHVWQEAGDRDSSVGTAIQAAVYRPRQIRHC